MPKIVIANVDSDAMCGTDMAPEIHALSSMCCCRLIVMAEDDDLVILPHSVSDAFITYVNGLFGRNLSAKNVIVPRRGDTEQIILNFDSLCDGDVERQVAERVGSVEGWALEAYFLDRAVIALAERLGLDVDERALGYLRAGGAESFNSKVLFRQLGAAAGIPIAEGRMASTAAELGHAVAELLPRTGRVMIKQDTNSGSAGNTAITTFGEDVLTGAWQVRQAPEDGDVEAFARALWPQVAVQRNTRVVVEVYHRSERVYYSELLIRGAGRAPLLLNFGEMRMEPTFIGFEIPSQQLSQFDIGEMIAHSAALGRAAGDAGFVGYMNIDSILTRTGKVMFTEVNGRMGDCTHIDYWARALLGDDYGRRHVLLTRNWISATSFAGTLRALDEAGVSYDHETRSGVVLPIEDVERSGTIDYLVIGDTLEHARDLEHRAHRALGFDPANHTFH
jgi:hypothetical protein